MAEPLEKKISKKKEKKRAAKQEQDLNNLSEFKWRRLGAFASWAGYRVKTNDPQQVEIIPVRKKANKFDLINITNNLKRYITKRKALDIERKRRKNKKKKSN